jgi:dextranase
MSELEILPMKASFDVRDAIVLEVRGGAGDGEVVVWRLGDEVLRAAHSRSPQLALGWLPEGSYGIEYTVGSSTVRTAVEVTAAGSSRLRYGFVVDYAPGRSLVGVGDLVRRLHLTDIQFYDWAYRHADLLGGGDNYTDALDQPITLQTVRELIAAVQAAGARALGYAAVYAVGPNEWPTWKHRAILTAEGEPYALGDFLNLVDPASADWLASFTAQLAQATTELGFDGFHLDQYGYPKSAIRADGATVDVATSFRALIESVRATMPSGQLVFNNVNDFPTWATASTNQDAVYIEVWEPNTTLGSLAAIVSRARGVAAGKPIVIAAYQHVYESAPAAAADLATSFTMATLFSHGATHLLAGEVDRILVDPYYVRNHVVEPSTADLLKRWYDFLIEHDELLMDPAIVEVTASYAGDYNDDCDVSFASAATTGFVKAGGVWRRITIAGNRLVVHLINLTAQDDDLWDAARNEPGTAGVGTLRFRRVGNGVPRVRFANPDGTPRLIDVPVEFDGNYATAKLPAFAIWQVVVIDLEAAK